MVRSVLRAIGKRNSMAHRVNPTKVHGSDKPAPRLQQMMGGYHKLDPPTEKKLTTKCNMPEHIAAGKIQANVMKEN